MPSVVTVAAGTDAVEGSYMSNGTFTLTRTDTTGNLSVNLSMSGTASSSVDYGLPMGAFFGDGQATTTVSIYAMADNISDPNETVILTITSGSGYTVGASPDDSATIHITDVTPVVTVAVGTDAIEGDYMSPGTFTFTRTDTTGYLSVNFDLSGTATSGTDYGPPMWAYFASGQATATVSISALTDNVTDPGETVVLTLASGSGYMVGAAPNATATIHITDTTPVVTIAKISDATEGGSDGVFRFTRSGDTSSGLMVYVSLSGTATSWSDYSPPMLVSFASGNSTVDYTLTATDDSTSKATETVIFTVATGYGYAPGSPISATMNIFDNDAQVVTVAKTNDAVEGGTDGTFTFTRVGDLSQALTVNYTVGGTATSGTDYTALPGSVTFAAGAATVEVAIAPQADNEFEDTEDIVVSLLASANGSYAIGIENEAVATLADNPPQVTMSVAWDADPNTPLLGSITATRSGGDINQPLTVWLEPTGTVVYDGDTLNITMAATAIIPAGQNSVTIPLVTDPAATPSALQMPGATPVQVRPDQSQQFQQLLGQFNGGSVTGKAVAKDLMELLTKLGYQITYQEFLTLRPLTRDDNYLELVVDIQSFRDLQRTVSGSEIIWQTLPQLQGANQINAAGAVTGFAAVLAAAGWPKTEIELQSLIADFVGTNEWNVREAASTRIRAMMTKALTDLDLVRVALIHDRLMKAAATSADPEVIMRAQNLITFTRGYKGMLTYHWAKTKAAAAAAVVGTWYFGSTLPY